MIPASHKNLARKSKLISSSCCGLGKNYGLIVFHHIRMLGAIIRAFQSQLHQSFDKIGLRYGGEPSQLPSAPWIPLLYYHLSMGCVAHASTLWRSIPRWFRWELFGNPQRSCPLPTRLQCRVHGHNKGSGLSITSYSARPRAAAIYSENISRSHSALNGFKIISAYCSMPFLQIPLKNVIELFCRMEVVSTIFIQPSRPA